MASRIVHLAIANEIIKAHPLPEPERFLFGSLLPDAHPDKSAHYNKYLRNGQRKTHDLTGFRRRFGDRLQGDSLYLGYYLHLLQDILFRHEMYAIVGYDPRPAGNVSQLHLDYELTNRYVIETYKLTNRVSIPQGLEAEPLWKDWSFKAEAFLAELTRDFTANPQGKTRFFTEAQADTLIRHAVPLCLQELEALNAGTGYFDEDRFAWERHS